MLWSSQPQNIIKLENKTELNKPKLQNNKKPITNMRTAATFQLKTAYFY